VAIEGGPRSAGDRHVIVVDRSTCTDYELFAAYPDDHGSCQPAAWHPASHDRLAHEPSSCWTAGSGAIFNLSSNHLRPAGWTSADAAGLPILPGLARYSEVATGAIDHALRFTAPCTGPHYVYPARHIASSCSGPYAPAMGLRVRLRASVDISGLPYQARVVATALKRYGMILADNGSPWYISGEPNRRWNNSLCTRSVDWTDATSRSSAQARCHIPVSEGGEYRLAHGSHREWTSAVHPPFAWVTVIGECWRSPPSTA
jgi:hypothetical protein